MAGRSIAGAYILWLEVVVDNRRDEGVQVGHAARDVVRDVDLHEGLPHHAFGHTVKQHAQAAAISELGEQADEVRVIDDDAEHAHDVRVQSALERTELAEQQPLKVHALPTDRHVHALCRDVKRRA